VAIVGGGCAALTTAFELSRPEHGGRFEVTVYQMGFRLGGKGASGRGASGRIEEHGLHLWMGFYENAFRLMRECYAELGRDPRRCPIADWRDAFAPAPDVAVTDRGPGGEWQHWVAHFPPGVGDPGDPLTGPNPFSVRGYLQQAASLVVELLRSAQGPRPERREPAMGPEDVVAMVERVLRYGQLATAAALFEAAELLRLAMDAVFPPVHRGERQGTVLRLIDALAAATRRQLDRCVEGDPELGRVWEVIDLILAILRGSVRFGLAFDPRGFDAIDDYDWRDWLRENGASPRALDSGFVRGIYDLAFAFEDGDVARPSLSAAVALRGAMRMFFTYRGSLFWRMGAGMGDVVFAPLYELLRRRGVRFEFFHRLARVRLGEPDPAAPGERPFVAALDFDVQAELAAGGEYHPLVDVDGLPCWPAQPDWDQLVDGERLAREGRAFESPWEARVAGARTLRVTDDFDLVVLGLGLGAVPGPCAELLSRDARWRAMVERVKTVATQAFQVWLRADARELGWTAGPVNLSGFVEPFDTWADMTHLAPVEAWETPPRNISYFCSVLDDAAPPGGADEAFAAREHARVRGHAVAFLDAQVTALWPRAAARGGGFRWELLATEAPGAPSGEGRFDTQFWTANVHPSDRYVLSVPGSSRHRLSPLDATFDNLTLAGDWTESGLNSGCVESAVMSGLLAAHALSGAPSLADIIGYDHP
jgi:uncharacterized protein with NAD-binding domain and iron-sulfur cluster